MKRLVLVGGGHAHVLVLLRFQNFISKHLEVSLVTPEPVHVYSGMVPGVVAGHYAPGDAHIDLARLCREAGAELIQAAAVSLDAAEKQLLLDDGRAIPYDIASLDVGSAPNYGGVPGAREHAVPAKPFALLLARWLELRATRPRIAVVGAGAGGVELAMAMKFAGALKVVLFSDKLQFAEKLRARLLRALERLEITLRTDTPVTAVEPGPTVISTAGRERFEAVVWAAGAAAPQLARDSGLQTDAAGFARVDTSLRSVSHPDLFVAGDAASMDRYTMPKSGVYAVRQGAVLAHNLQSLLQGGILRDFRPQAKSLSLISCGGRYAVASRGAWSAEGAWAWRWKDWIDRRWIERFR